MNVFRKNKKQLSIFVTAGYPTINGLSEQLKELDDFDVDFIEVGMPFSDPMADGEVIQQTSELAIKNGMHIALLFEQLKDIKFEKPIVLMGYLNPVLNFGLETFLQECEACNVKSVILPDMSIEIFERFYEELFKKYKVTPAFIVTPTTSDERVSRIAVKCLNSFVYLVSTSSTTGGEIQDQGLHQRYQEIKVLCGDTPMFMGFGIRTKQDVQRVQQFTDGAIIGSAYLRAVQSKSSGTFLQEICN